MKNQWVGVIRKCKYIYRDHLAWPLVVGALLVIAKRGAQPETPAKLLGANCAGPIYSYMSCII
jgi:hypothetical protein